MYPKRALDGATFMGNPNLKWIKKMEDDYGNPHMKSIWNGDLTTGMGLMVGNL